MTIERELSAAWIELNTQDSEVLLTGSPFLLCFSATAPADDEDAHGFNPPFLVPKDSIAYVRNPAGGSIIASRLDGGNPFL